MEGKHITQANEATVTALKTLLKLLNINDDAITVTNDFGFVTIYISSENSGNMCSIDIMNTNVGSSANVIASDTKAEFHAHGASATEFFGQCTDTETIISLNAPDDEGKTTIKQDAVGLSFLHQNGSYHGGGFALLNFPTVIEIDDNEFTYTLPQKSGTIAIDNAITGTFTTTDGKTITVTNGMITSIV